MSLDDNSTLDMNSTDSDLDSTGKMKKKPSYFYDPNICVFEIPIDDETECGRKKLASKEN